MSGKVSHHHYWKNHRWVALTPFAVMLLYVATGGLTLAGCGGGDSGGTEATPTPTPTATATPSATARAQVTVHWPARSRGTLNGLSSALSLRVTLVGASPSGQDAAFFVNRRTNPAAYAETFSAPADVLVGTWDLRIRFHAQPDGAGDVVGTADTRVTLAADGNLPDITTTGLIRTVEVASGQNILVGERKDLSFTARGDGGTVIAVTPGSAFFTVMDGPDRLRIVGGQAEGLLPGTASVTASVDGMDSPAPVPVLVTSNATVTVTPNPAQVAINGVLPFQATVANAPNGGVTWAIQEGAAGGSISPSGVYTAPATPGTYTVVATSVYDPARQAVVPVSVQAGGLNVGGEFPASGDVNVIVD